ncbi:MAG: hypothetical protein AB7S86_10305 [Hydrogenophaga sp.]|uniref:hypothetical protein n=1 Tax=Hydrogenophaga sp. TaxID=1904254 RepID=UPI003D0B145E
MSSPTLNRSFLILAFVLGLVAIAWVGSGFVGTSAIALAMTVLIGAVYLLGAQEIRRFRAVTASLAQALNHVPQPLERLDDWLASVPTALQNAVRQRVQGERGVLPGLALTPYLIGLLVMLGMLGTFLGMVVTFKGVVFTLEGSADLQAIRSALATPIKGLGLAFGTSVVGVATSAMLGLMSALSRRERQEVARQLDTLTATTLHPFSLAHQRLETFKALQQQAGALPAVVNQLGALMEQMERRSQQQDEQLLARQAHFHREASEAFSGLARSVEQSLKESLAASARAAGESLQPVVTSAMNAITQDTTRQHQRVNDAVQAQMASLTERLEERQAAWAASLQTLATTLQGEWKQAGAQTLQQQQAANDQLAQTATLWRNELATLRSEESARGEAVMQRLLHTAAEAPRAAAQVMTQLRSEMSALTERDNRALQERTALMSEIDGLLKSVEQATGEQRLAIESLVTSAGAVLEQVGRQFAETVGAQAVRAEDMAAQVKGSTIELASLGEAFGHGVQGFSSTNEKLIASLQGIEAAVSQSIARSDEQLAYYVAQAREVIDLSITSQQGILEDLRRLRSAEPVARAEKKAVA